MRVWFADDNAIVREKTDEIIVQRRTPLLNAIVHQGIREGVFTTPYPDQAGQVILSITGGMGNAILKLVLAFDQAPDEQHYIDEIVAATAAMAEAVERVLGSSVRILERLDAFEHYGYRWEQVHIVEPGFLNAFDKGKPIYVLLKCDSSPHVYQFEAGQKRRIGDIPTFQAQGYVWDDIKFVSCAELRSLPDGDSIPPGRGTPPPPLP